MTNYIDDGTNLSTNVPFFGRKVDIVLGIEALEQNKFLIITGMAGIGKTVLAEAIAKEWIKTEGCSTYKLSFAISLLYTLSAFPYIHDIEGVNDSNISNDTSYDSILAKLSAYFEEHPNCLLVIDDVDNTDGLQEMIDKLSCPILITTRHNDIKQTVQTTRLSALDKDDCVDLFMYYSGHKALNDIKPAIETIVIQAQYHPIITTLLACYVHVTGVSLNEFEENLYRLPAFWQASKKRILDNATFKRMMDDFFEYSAITEEVGRDLIADTTDYERDKIDSKEAHNRGSAFLKTLSVLDMRKVRAKSLCSWCNIDYSNDNAVQTLVNRGWLKKSTDVDPETGYITFFYTMDGVIHETLQRNLKLCNKDYSETIELLEKKVKNSNRDTIYPLIDQALALFPLFPGAKSFALTLADKAFDLEMFTESYSIYARIIQLEEQSPNEINHHLAISYVNMGFFLRTMGNLDDALIYYRKALTVFEEVYDGTSLDLALYYANLGSLLHDLEKYDEALIYYQKDIAISEQVLDPLSPELAISYNNMGMLLKDIGKSDEALDYYRKALVIQEQILDDMDYNLAISYNNMAILLQKTGQLDEALKFHRRSLAIFEEILDETSLDLAISYNNLGLVLKAMGIFDDALDCYHKSLTIKEKVLDKTSPSLATTYANIGLLLYVIGKLDEARDYWEKELTILESARSSSSKLFDSYTNLSVVCTFQNKKEEARHYHNKAKEIRNKQKADEVFSDLN